MSDVNFRIGLYEAKVIVPIQEFAPGTYTFQFGMPAGNSILSTVFVQDLDGGASVKVNYHDSGPGDGTQPGERVDLDGHPLISTGTPRSDRRIIARLANKPKAEVIVSGGNATLGLHIAVVADFPQEPNLLDGQTAELNNDKGAPVMVLGSDDKWYAWRGDNGVAKVEIVQSPDDLPVLSSVVNHRQIYANDGFEYSYSLPSNTRIMTLKTSTPNAKILVAWSSGTTSTLGQTVYSGTQYEKENIDPTNNWVVYWQSNKPNTEIEIETWQGTNLPLNDSRKLTAVTLHKSAYSTTGVEYSYGLPSGTKEIYFKTSTPNAKLQLAWSSGQTTNGQSIFSGSQYSRIDLDPNLSWTIFWQSNKDNSIIEIETWR
jgi:hypothetical protein